MGDTLMLRDTGVNEIQVKGFIVSCFIRKGVAFDDWCRDWNPEFVAPNNLEEEKK